MKYQSMTSDVTVIGGGLSGTLAALGIAERGFRVTVLRDGRGASPHVAGFNLPGVEEGDSAACFLEDTFKSAAGQADPVLAGILCNGSAALRDDLKRLGFLLDVDENGKPKARKSLGSSFARVVGKGNSTGADILAIADRLLREKENVTILEHTRALRLLKRKNRISGVWAYEKERENFFTVRSACVLMACGGYAGIFPFSSNTKDISGDGIAMALLAGAHVTDMEFVQFEPSCAVYPGSIRGKGMITTLFYEGAILTNALGERFMLRHSPDAERVNKDVLARCIAVELREGRGTERNGVYFDARGVDRQRMLDAYAPFVTRYRNVGIDLLTEPVEVANAAHTSLGGLKVDRNCETNIKGLYAVGEALGNLHGANRLGGSAGSETLVFSKYAANIICKSLEADGGSNDFEGDVQVVLPEPAGKRIAPARIKEINGQLSGILEKHLGVCRDGAGLREAVKETEQLLREVQDSSFGTDDRCVFEKCSLENRLITAVALARSALLRDDSVGSHWRLDCERSPAERYRTDVAMHDGVVCASKICFSV